MTGHAALPQRPEEGDQEWRAQAACLGQDTKVWFPARAEVQLEAKAVCLTECPVQEQCLAYAMEAREPYGVWGGLNPQERERLRRRPSWPAFKQCAKCGQTKPATDYRERVPGQLRPECKTCQNAQKNAWQKKRRRRRGAVYPPAPKRCAWVHCGKWFQPAGQEDYCSPLCETARRSALAAARRRSGAA